ncbi:MAG: hypothetical protein DI588_09185 [Flavobacterium johnsoniae]|nr:MAG: hypothetical protein DI588_09185 [Flavobacterium johnsoniae]
MFFRTKIPIIYQLRDNVPQEIIRSGQYFWVLYWIGGHFYENSKLYNVFYFVLTTEAKHDFGKHNYKVRKNIKLESGMLRFFHLGSIFDKRGSILRYPTELVYKSGNVINIDKIVFKKDILPTTKKSFRCFSKNFYNIPTNISDGFYYFSATVLLDGEETEIILPVLTFCQYVYFKYPILIDYILNYKTDEILFNDRVKLLNDKKVGTITFDQEAVTFDEIHSLSQFFFINKDYGKKSINLLGSSLQYRYRQDQRKKTEKSYYLYGTLPFPCDISLNIVGTKFKSKSKNYFFVYSITSISLISNKEIFTVSSLNIGSKANVPDNSKNILLIRQKKEEGKKAKDILPKHLIKSPLEPRAHESVIESFSIYLGLEINRIGLSEPEEKYNMKSVSRIAKKITAESKKNKRYLYLQVYFEGIIKELSLKLDVNYITISDLYVKNYRNVIYYKNRDHEVMIADVVYRDNFFYLAQFSQNFIILFSNIYGFKRIPDIELKLLIGKFVREYVEYQNRYRTIMINKEIEFRNNYGIKIYTSLIYAFKGDRHLADMVLSGSRIIFDKIMTTVKKDSA